MTKRRKKLGFTLIEMSFSILFIAILSLTLVMLTVNMMGNYQRGVVLKQINTTGNNLIDEFRSSIAASSAKNITDVCDNSFTLGAEYDKCKNDNAYSAVYVVRNGNVQIGPSVDNVISNVPLFGAFCSGTYSYIWNSGYLFGDNYHPSISNRASFTYYDENSVKKTKSDFKILKVRDPSRLVCTSKSQVNGLAGKTYINSGSSTLITGMDTFFDVTADADNLFQEEPVDILANDSGNYNDFALYDLTIYRPAQDLTTRNVLYSGSFILATVSGGINIKANGDYCVTPSDYVTGNFDYCAINNFNFAIRASGE